MQSQRLYFIDAVRAFAILMMLQGHFIDTLLDPTYRDHTNIAFRCWEYFRGITAPTFFTISGLIFSYLLIRAKTKGNAKERIKKGLIRGLMLIGIGYLLRVPVFEWLMGRFNSQFFVVDVLQCIGLSLISIVCVYQLVQKKTILFSIVMLLLGLVIFITEPLYRHLELNNIPELLSNYLSKSNGSVFTIIPWFGYMCFGAFMSTLFYYYLQRPKFKITTVSGFLIIGLLLIWTSSWVLMVIYNVTDVQIFKDAAWYNYLFSRLGNVLVIFALFYLFETYIKRPLILKIGQKTLAIYVIHFIIIYGSFTGYGLHQIIGKTLVPWQAIVGAIIFLIVVCFLALNYVKANKFIYSSIRRIIDRVKQR